MALFAQATKIEFGNLLPYCVMENPFCRKFYNREPEKYFFLSAPNYSIAYYFLLSESFIKFQEILLFLESWRSYLVNSFHFIFKW